MADVQVTCIIKPNPQSTVEHITHLGGAQWTWTRNPFRLHPRIVFAFTPESRSPCPGIPNQTPEAFRESFAPSPPTVEMPQILAAVKAKPHRAPAAALTATPVCWPDPESGAKWPAHHLVHSYAYPAVLRDRAPATCLARTSVEAKTYRSAFSFDGV